MQRRLAPEILDIVSNFDVGVHHKKIHEVLIAQEEPVEQVGTEVMHVQLSTKWAVKKGERKLAIFVITSDSTFPQTDKCRN